MIKKVMNFIIASMMCFAVITGCSANADVRETEQTDIKSWTKETVLEKIDGITDRYVIVNSTDINFLEGITYDKFVIEEIVSDHSKVDLSRTGTYDLLYTVIITNDVASKILESKNSSDVTETNDQLSEKEFTYTVKVHVVENSEVVKLLEEGKTVWTSGNKKYRPKEEKETEKKSSETAEHKNDKDKNKEDYDKTPEIVPNPSGDSNSTEKPSKTPTESSKPSVDKESVKETEPNKKEDETENTAPEINETERPEIPSDKETGEASGKVWHDPVYEDVWVVDVEAWTEIVTTPIYETTTYAVCPQCGRLNPGTDPNVHISQTGHGSWYTDTDRKVVGYEETLIEHPEEGHWEKELVKEGYWE